MPTPMVAPDNVMVFGGITVTVPPHSWKVAVLAVSPEGIASRKLTPVRAAGLPDGLLIVKTSWVEPFSPTMLLANDFEMEGGASTIRLALAVLPVPALVEVTCTLLFNVPAVLPCTVTETAHELLTAIDPLARLTEPAPPLAVTVPPQVLVAPGVPANTIPVGKVSVKATPVSARLALGLVMVNVKVLVPPSATEVGLKPLVIAGGVVPTFSMAVAVLPVPPLVEVTAPVVLV